MYLASSIISALFFFLLIGSFIRPQANQVFSTFIVGALTKSMWLSWFIFLIAFYTKLNFLAPLVVVFGSLILVYYLYTSRFRNSNYLQWSGDTSIVVFSVMMMVSILLFIFKGGDFNYQLVFTKYDAVASWNRWGVELSEGVYDPYNAAYPIALPGIWSLVYQVQGDVTNWLVTKGSTLIILMVLMLYTCFKVIEDKSASAWLVFLGVAFIFLKKIDQFSNGYMDAIVAALILLGFLVHIDALKKLQGHEPLSNEGKNILWVSVFCISVAAVTKQPGFASVVILATSLTLLRLKNNIGIREYGLMLAILFLPVLTFFNLFLDTGFQVVGLYNHLQNLSDSNTNGKGQIEYALEVMSEGLSLDLLFLLLAVSFLNITNLKSRVGQFGTLCLLTSVIGFYIYSDCCAYVQRNSLWIFSFLITSAACAISELDSNFLRKEGVKAQTITIKPVVYTLVLLPIFILATLFPTKESVMEVNDRAKLKMISPKVNMGILENLSKLSETGAFVTTYSFARWLPKLPDDIEYCNSVKADITSSCIADATEQYTDVLILKRRMDFKEANKVLLSSYHIETNGVWELFYLPKSKGVKEELAIQKMLDLSDMTGVWSERFRRIRKDQCHLDLSVQGVEQFDRQVCLQREASPNGWLVLGDSFAADMYSSLSSAFPSVSWLQATSLNCSFKIDVEEVSNTHCEDFSKLVKEILEIQNLRGVVLDDSAGSGRYSNAKHAILFNYLRELGMKVIVVGPRPAFKESASSILKSSLSVLEAEKKAFDLLGNTGSIESKSLDIEKLLGDDQFYIDVFSMQCRDAGSCDLLSNEGQILYASNSLLSAAGMDKIALQLKGYQWKNQKLIDYLIE